LLVTTTSKINQSIKISIALLQDLYSEALPEKSLEKVVELRTGTVWEVPWIY